MKTLLKGVGILLAIGVLAIAAVFGINATDEAMSEEALSALKRPAAPPSSERNAFVDLERLPSSPVDDRLPACPSLDVSCLDAAKGAEGLQARLDQHRAFLRAYLAMREKPEFIDLAGAASSPTEPVPAFQGFFVGQRLSLLGAALRFHTGDRSAAITELEREYEFYRRVAMGSRSLLTKMIAFAALDRAGLFAADIARHLPPGDTASFARLEAIVRAPTRGELDLSVPIRMERGQTVEWMRTRKHVRIPKDVYEMFKSAGEPIERPWWEPLSPYLYRPHQSVNKFAAQSGIMLGATALPSTGFLDGVAALRTRAAALEPGRWERSVVNPTGHGHYFLKGYDLSDYIGRAHGLAGTQSLVRLQVRLRAAGITKPDDVAAALAGELGREHPHPFTGKPPRYVKERHAIAVDIEPRYLTSTMRLRSKPSEGQPEIGV